MALKRSMTSSMTGRFKENDRPKSPWIILPSQIKYRSGKLLSRPKSLLIFATFSGVAYDPRIAVAGSPGIREIIKKTIIVIPKTTGIADSNRFIKYLIGYEKKDLHEPPKRLAELKLISSSRRLLEVRRMKAAS